MIITSIEALVVRVPKEWGCVGRLADYPGRDVYPATPEEALETVLARVETGDGLFGWGESQALSAPQVAGTIIDAILRPSLEGREFGGAAVEIEALWNDMYNRMRLCGHTGGFMLDAIAAVDLALWDLAGKIHGFPVAQLIAGKAAKPRVEGVVNCLAGETAVARANCAREYADAGCRKFKIFYQGSRRELLDEFDLLAGVCGSQNVAVDALWNLDPAAAPALGAELDRRGALWLENPFAPEDPRPPRRPGRPHAHAYRVGGNAAHASRTTALLRKPRHERGATGRRPLRHYRGPADRPCGGSGGDGDRPPPYAVAGGRCCSPPFSSRPPCPTARWPPTPPGNWQP